MKKYISFILPALLIAGIIFLSYMKIFNGKNSVSLQLNFDIIIISIYILWMIYELKISHNDFIPRKTVSDSGTREFYAFSHAATVLSALWADPLQNNFDFQHGAGFLIFISGVCIRIMALRALGKYYSHIVRIIEDHKIIDYGPYKYIRHPAYSGMITAHLGILIFFFNFVTLGIFLMLLIPSIIIRIKVEEKTLMNLEGYPEYSKNRKRIIPFIW